MSVLTGIDVLGIQAYVFASNRLRDVLAASWLVEQATSRAKLANWGLDQEQVVLAGGGNAVLEFDSVEKAHEWTAHYTRCLADKAPGIEVAVVHQPGEGGPLAWAMRALRVGLARVKLERLPSASQLGLSVTANCAISGLPAVSEDHGELVSHRVAKLRKSVEAAKQRWRDYLPPGFSLPDEIDQMGRTRGDKSLVGFIHLDGDGVGSAIGDWLDRCIREHLPDDEVRRQCREWSEGIEKLGESVLKTIVDHVVACMPRSKMDPLLRGTPDRLRFSPYRPELLPLQPILLGGDDLTLICDGRIALDLATTAQRAFSQKKVPHLGSDGEPKQFSACAGVALVKAHAPFHRSYQLAAGLCQSAKKARRKKHHTGAWLDWHIGTTRPAATVADIRQRGYTRRGSKLTMRPYRLDQKAPKGSWDWLDGELLGPGNPENPACCGFRGDKRWAGSRRRVRMLGSLVAEKGLVERQLAAWRILDQGLSLPGGLSDDGSIGSYTPLLDAVELLDLHFRLNRKAAVPDKSSAKTSNHEEGEAI